MVHSGSAAGGHYYACIKSFSDEQWYSFNDQHVSRITQEDIKKTHGGSSGSRGYYSSAFASSTNAYMLIYRLKDPARNAKFLEVDEYPEHIKNLVQRERELEEQEKRQREIERNTCKIKLFCLHPVKQVMMENKLEVHKDKTLKEAVEMAYKVRLIALLDNISISGNSINISFKIVIRVSSNTSTCSHVDSPFTASVSLKGVVYTSPMEHTQLSLRNCSF